MTVGKFKKIKSYSGLIAELFVYFYPLNKNEIEEHYNDGLQEIQSGDGKFIIKQLQKDEAEHNRKMFATERHIPAEALTDIKVSPSFFKTAKEDTTSQLNDRVPLSEAASGDIDNENKAEVMYALDTFIFENPIFADDLTKIAKNYEWILKVTSIMATGEINKEGAIELSRFMKVLKFCKIHLSSEVIWQIVEITKTSTTILDEHDDKVKHKAIMHYYFLKILKEVVFGHDISQIDDDEYEKISVGHYSDSDDHSIEIEEFEEEKVEEVEEKPVAVNMRKDSFHSSPGKINWPKKRLQNEEGEGEGDENEGDKTMPPVIEEEHIVKPTPTEINEPSLNEYGMIKHEHDDALQPVIKEDPPAPEEQESVHKGNEDNESLPEIEDGWNTGAFEIHITRWNNCYKHFEYSRHSEDEYVNEFNKVGSDIVEKFPEAIVIGNHDKPSYLGWFDIYLRGVGPVEKRDNQGRLFIFRKNVTGRFPSIKEVIDYLIILSMLYGNSEKLGKAQDDFKHNYGYLISKQSSDVHEHPWDMPEKLVKQPEPRKVAKQGDRLMVCKNWGCGKDYQEDRNDKKSWTHHPGKYQFGSRHGLWPESWTCCRAEWDSMGWRKGFHRGVPKEEFTRLCINHGEPNPDSIYPDSFCGKPFGEFEKKPEWQITQQDREDRIQWFIHSGYLKVDKRSGFSQWSWCGEDKDAEPWWKSEHKAAEFPDEEAKKYFYDKPLKPIGVVESGKNVANEFEIYGRFCGLYRDTKLYIPKNPPEKVQISRDEQKKLDQLDQVCLHWGCGKIFKEANNHKRSWLWHTGRWDFGNSVKGCSNSASDNLMWDPHWTCCRKDWSDPGCKRMKHKGTYLENYESIKREYQWPDVRAQIYFKKKISYLWRKKMMELWDYDEETLIAKIEKKERDNRGRLSVRDLEELWDYLRLNLLINSDDMSYHFKFQDVINGSAHSYLDDGSGDISKEKFVKWWFMTTEELLHKDDPPASPEKEPAKK